MNNFDIFQDNDYALNIQHERQMFLAVVLQAFEDIIHGSNKETKEACTWLLDPSNKDDRKIVCELAGIDVTHAQRLAKKLLLEYHHEGP